MGQRAGEAHGGGSSTLDRLVRWSSTRDGGRVLTPFSSTIRRAGSTVPHVHSTWRRVILAILPVKENLVFATEALLGAAMHGVGGSVANKSPTGESQRNLARGWHGGPSRADTDHAALAQSVMAPVAKRSLLFVVRDALLAPQLRLAQRLLVAGVFRGPDGGIMPPALQCGEHLPWQCISALTSREATSAREPFDVVPYVVFCGRCDGLLRRRAHPCKHLIFCRGLVLVKRNGAAAETELPRWSADTPMYLNLERFRSATASAPAAAAGDPPADGGGEKVITPAGLEDLVSAPGQHMRQFR